MKFPLSRKTIPALRTVVQWVFLFWTVGIGIRFALFVNAIERGAVPAVSRPAGVEAFLPIGALTSLKYWLATGIIHPVHPAAVVIFLAIVLMSLVARKSFCSWVCPVGTVSELVHRVGRRIVGRSFRIWRWPDRILRGIKYLLLGLFVKLILIDMPVAALGAFMDAPYWAVSDIKMLRFFTSLSTTAAVIIVLLAILSLLYRNFWCRYLCPYGALLGLGALLSPFGIRRDESACTGCRACSASCPSSLPVHSLKRVSSAECSGCLTCVASCPHERVLEMQLPFRTRQLPVWLFPAMAIAVFGAVIAAGMLSGHWQTSLGVEDYRQLLPMLSYLSH